MRFDEIKEETFELFAAAVWWLMSKEKLPFVAAEIGEYRSDIYGVGDECSAEIEVKRSVSDLKSELNKAKHIFFLGDYPTEWKPKKFYFLVPKSIAEDALHLLETEPRDRGSHYEQWEKYGLLSYDMESWECSPSRSYRYSSQFRDRRVMFPPIKTIRQAQKLHNKAPHKEVVKQVREKMVADIARLYFILIQMRRGNRYFPKASSWLPVIWDGAEAYPSSPSAELEPVHNLGSVQTNTLKGDEN